MILNHSQHWLIFICMHLCIFHPSTWSVIFQVLHFPGTSISVGPDVSVIIDRLSLSRAAFGIGILPIPPGGGCRRGFFVVGGGVISYTHNSYPPNSTLAHLVIGCRHAAVSDDCPPGEIGENGRRLARTKSNFRSVDVEFIRRLSLSVDPPSFLFLPLSARRDIGTCRFFLLVRR